MITDYGLIVIEVNEDEGSEHGGFGGRVIKLDINYCLSTLIYWLEFLVNSIVIKINEEEGSKQGGFGGRLKGCREGQTELVFQPEAAQRSYLVVKHM